jgi:protein transport protein SEC31
MVKALWWNFEAAVECCFQTGNLADALVLASCGGPDFEAKTQERYFIEGIAQETIPVDCENHA